MVPSRAKRCLKLLDLLYSDGRHDAKALAKLLRVSQRQLYRDLRFIEEAIGKRVSLVSFRRMRDKM